MAAAAPAKPAPMDLDVVVVTSSGKLDFLELWRPYFGKHHLIIVSLGAAPGPVPSGFSHTLFTKKEVDSLLGKSAWCLSNDAVSAKCVGFLVSKKKYVLTIDEDCTPASDPAGKPVDALAQHLTNLNTPATPYFFNTLYDPYRPGTDFVRGYPFSLREGVPTAVSHGMWLNVPDYDAPTQMVKPNERNARYVDAALSVPRGALYSMSCCNLAVNRELIGPALYFGPSQEGQSNGRSAAVFAGWCIKIICDHLGWGCKTGIPYVKRSPTAPPANGQHHQFSDVFLRDEVVPFLQSVQLSNDSTTVEACVTELAGLIKKGLGPLDAHFHKVADGMVEWLAVWRQNASK